MMRITFSAAILALAGALSLAGCGEPDDASRIAQLLETMEAGIEEQRTGPVLAPLAEDFHSDDDLRRREIRGLLLYHYRRYPAISLVTSDQRIRIDGERADVTLNALVLGGRNRLPERGRRYAVSMRWQKTAGDWQLARIKWRQPE